MSKEFETVIETFCASLSDVLKHPDCPDALAHSLVTWFCEFKGDLTPAMTAEDEAQTIARELPELVKVAMRKGGAR